MNPLNILEEHKEGFTWSWYKYYYYIDLVRSYRQKLNHCFTLRASTYENNSHVHGSAVQSLMSNHTLKQTTAAQTKEDQVVEQQKRRNPNICKKATALEIHLVTWFPNLPWTNIPAWHQQLACCWSWSCDVSHRSPNPGNVRSQGSKLVVQKGILLKLFSSVC